MGLWGNHLIRRETRAIKAQTKVIKGQAQGGSSGSSTGSFWALFAVVFAIVLVVKFWYVTVPVLGVVGAVIWYKRHRSVAQSAPSERAIRRTQRRNAGGMARSTPLARPKALPPPGKPSTVTSPQPRTGSRPLPPPGS